MSLFWEELTIEPGRSARQCSRGEASHFRICYEEMLTPENRSTLECRLEPGHEGAHASEIGFSADGICDLDMWLCRWTGVPGAREIRQPGACAFELGDQHSCPFQGHTGMHLAQGLGFVTAEGKNHFSEHL
ncbi:hypothetical protein ACFYXM_31220 [Streptomyces sp. NPDC002476]|uniref:hypothetical protein n=1 Tax=Streptomyces sp. NPDC002476 TaxID=3364648 RepID=UPI0036CCD826